MTSKSVDIVEQLRREHALTAKLDSAQYGEWAGYIRMLGKLAGDAANEIDRLISVADAEMKMREGNFAEIERLRAALELWEKNCTGHHGSQMPCGAFGVRSSSESKCEHCCADVMQKSEDDALKGTKEYGW